MDDNPENSRDFDLTRYSKGVARVQLSALDFDHDLLKRKHRRLSEKVVARLVEVFRREGCRRNEEANFIDAVVDEAALEQALSSARITSDSIEDGAQGLHMLPLRKVQCLHGLHRIVAAQSTLDQNDQWWTVRLYSGLPETISTKIIEGSINEQPYSDGEILRKILFYRRSQCKGLENKWWARLSSTKQKDLKQLLRKSSFLNVLDSLVDMHGLWNQVKLGTLHRLLTLRCDEELLHYLHHVSAVWNSILQCGQHRIPLEAVDYTTVEKLELMAPSSSEADRRAIEHYIESGDIFSQISDEALRGQLKDNILSVETLIPTLRSFFENLKYLEPCSLILRKLIDPSEKRSLFRSLKAAYFSPDGQLIESAEARSHLHANFSEDVDVWTSYVQLWAFCMRNFPCMTSLQPRKELGKDKPSSQVNAALWQYLGDLAVKLGFRTRQALQFQQKNAHEELARQIIQSAYPGQVVDAGLMSEIIRALARMGHEKSNHNTPYLTQNDRLPVERRCGRPFENDYESNRESLYLPLIYGSESSRGPDISSFYIKRDLFVSFFGNKYIPNREFIDGNRARQPTLRTDSTPLPLGHECLGNCETAINAEAESRQANERIHHLESRIQTMQQSLNDNAQHVNDLAQQLQGAQSGCETLRQQLQLSKNNEEHAVATNTTNEQMIQRHLATIQDLQTQTQRLTAEHSRCHQSDEEHREKSSRLEGAFQDLERKFQQLAVEHSRCQESDEEHHGNASRLKNEIIVLRADIEEVRRQLDEKTTESERLTHRIESLKDNDKEIRELRESVLQHQHQASESAKLEAILQQKIRDLQHLGTVSSNKEINMSGELQEKTLVNDHQAQQIAGLTERLGEVEGLLETKTRQLLQAEDETDKIRKLFTQSEHHENKIVIKNLRQDIDTLKKQLAEATQYQSQDVNTLKTRLSEATGYQNSWLQQFVILSKRDSVNPGQYKYFFTIFLGHDQHPIHIGLNSTESEQAQRILKEINDTIDGIEKETNKTWEAYCKTKTGLKRITSPDEIPLALLECGTVYCGEKIKMLQWRNTQPVGISSKRKRKKLDLETKGAE